jgi:hypothetical protein
VDKLKYYMGMVTPLINTDKTGRRYFTVAYDSSMRHLVAWWASNLLQWGSTPDPRTKGNTYM